MKISRFPFYISIRDLLIICSELFQYCEVLHSVSPRSLKRSPCTHGKKLLRFDTNSFAV